MSTPTAPRSVRCRHRTWPVAAELLLGVATLSCGSDMSGPSQPAACDQVEPTTLITGQFVVTDASRVTCVRIPEAGAAGAEYLYVAVSAAANESSAGTSTPYRLVGKDEGGVATARRAGPVPASLQLSPARRFHDRLRVLERKLARSPPATSPRTGALAAAAPALGDRRTFSVLRSADASGSSSGDYVPVNATAKFAGRTVSIYLDDAAPIGGGYTRRTSTRSARCSRISSIRSTPPRSGANPTSTAMGRCWGVLTTG